MRFFSEADPTRLSKLILWEQNNDRPHRCAHKGEETEEKTALELLACDLTPFSSSSHEHTRLIFSPQGLQPCAKYCTTEGEWKQHLCASVTAPFRILTYETTLLQGSEA